MTSMAPSIPLAADFADRLEALRTEAAEAGHTDIDHIVDMAVEIARRRIEVAYIGPPLDGASLSADPQF